ncbi:MAG: CoA transferase [Chloroflexi bacterium]|nr:CoA transferase [Chloroflexota bacterium]
MARLGPGPHCSRILADLGADVIRVEEPGQGQGRRAGRMIRFPGNAAIRRNSRSIGLNLKSEQGVDVFRRLAKTADVITDGFRPGVAKRLGVDYDAIKAIKPDIIYCAMTGYGQTGPYSDYVGHDINYQGLTGMMDMTGQADGPPTIPGSAIADNAGGGMNAAIGILTALLAKERSGVGQYIDMAMVDGVTSLLYLTIDDHFVNGTKPRRGETLLTGLYPWYNVYQTADGKYLTVGAIEPWFYENLCRILGREDFIPDQYAEGERREEIFTAFRETFRTKTRDEWTNELMPAETCVAPVLSIAEAAADPHLRERGMIVDIDDPEKGRHRQVGVMVKLSETPGEIRSTGPEVGANTTEIMTDLGYSAGEVETLRESGAIG